MEVLLHNQQRKEHFYDFVHVDSRTPLARLNGWPSDEDTKKYIQICEKPN